MTALGTHSYGVIQPLIARRLPTVLILALLSACSRAPTIDSERPAKLIVIDGRDDDWTGRRYVLETVTATFAVANDDDYLYVSALTSDRDVQMRILRAGVELWLDPEGKNQHTLGVRLPGRAFDPLRGGPEGGRPTSWTEAVTADRLDFMMEQLVGPRPLLLMDGLEDDGTPMRSGPETTIQGQIGFEQGRLQCEIRLPLTHVGHPTYRIDAAGSVVAVAMRLPAPQRPSGLLPDGARGGRGGGMGRGGGGMGGTGAGGRGGRRMAETLVEPVEQWVRLRLAP